MKLMFIGIDCLDGVHLMNSLDELPNFKRLKGMGGSMGPCKSITIAEKWPNNMPHTGPCWISIYTGVHPVIHGILKGGWTAGEKFYSDRRVNSIWDIIDQEGLSLCLFNLPITWPPPEVDGWVVSGFITPEKDFCYPPELRQELPEDYLTDVLPTHTAGNLGKAREIAVYKLLLFKRLYTKRPTDIAGIGISMLDRFFHIGRYGEGLSIVDDFLGYYLDNFDPDHLCIISDHGGVLPVKGWGLHSIDAFYYTSWGDELETISDLAHSIRKVLKLKGNLRVRRIVEEMEVDPELKAAVMKSLKRLGYID